MMGSSECHRQREQPRPDGPSLARLSRPSPSTFRTATIRSFIGTQLDQHLFSPFSGWIPPLMVSLTHQLFPSQPSPEECMKDFEVQDEATGVFINSASGRPTSCTPDTVPRQNPEGFLLSLLALPFVLFSAIMTTLFSISLTFLSCTILLISIVWDQPARLSFVKTGLKQIVESMVSRASNHARYIATPRADRRQDGLEGTGAHKAATLADSREGERSLQTSTKHTGTGTTKESLSALYQSFKMTPQSICFTESVEPISSREGLKRPGLQESTPPHTPGVLVEEFGDEEGELGIFVLRSGADEHQGSQIVIEDVPIEEEEGLTFGRTNRNPKSGASSGLVKSPEILLKAFAESAAPDASIIELTSPERAEGTSSTGAERTVVSQGRIGHPYRATSDPPGTPVQSNSSLSSNSSEKRKGRKVHRRNWRKR